MSLWSRQQVTPLAIASVAGFLVAALAAHSLTTSPSPRILKAPEPSEDGPYKYTLFDGGSVLQTPYGKLRFYELGPKEGKKILLIHGISTPCVVWQRIIPQLVNSGHRVLCYDLVGRGYSDAPAHLQHNISLYISQLCMLLTSLPEWSGSFNVIGYSMGATIATTFASYFPDRVNSLLLYAPAGMIKSPQLPWLERTATSQFLNFNETIQWQSRQHTGFMHAFTSSLTNDMIWDLHQHYQSVQDKFGDRMQAIVGRFAGSHLIALLMLLSYSSVIQWGDQDITCPPKDAESIRGLKVHIIKGGKHDMIVQLPLSDEIGQITINFLSSK